MNIVSALSIIRIDPPAWLADWTCGLLIILVTVLVHVLGLLLITRTLQAKLSNRVEPRSYAARAVTTIGATALLMTILHVLEAVIWAVAYRLLGAIPDMNSAILYSLGAITSYGHANLNLERHWQLLGALEALNGLLLFGVTTAFLFAVIQKVWQVRTSS